MKAILVPYASGQNEPSKPLNFIADLDEDVNKRFEQLKKYFFEYVFSSEEDVDVKYINVANERFGDCYVCEPGAEVYLFATFVQEG